MPATSTSTLLDVVNDVLLDVGERRVTSLTAPFAQKAAKYVQDAVREIQRFHNWSWLYDTITPTSWSGNTATLDNVNRILHVSWDNSSSGAAYWRLKYLDPEEYDAQIIADSFDSTVETATYPRVWSISSRNTIKVNPYPTDAAGQARVKVYVIRDMVPPTAPTGTFPLPEDHVSLLNKYATAQMYYHHLDDKQGASGLKQQFDEQLAYIRARESKNPGGYMNMYRRNRRYTR